MCATAARPRHLRDLKGLSDLAVLLARPGADVHVLELAATGPHDSADGGPCSTRRPGPPTAAGSPSSTTTSPPRGTTTTSAGPSGWTPNASPLLAELRRAAGLGGRDRALGTSTTERARKAVTARLRDAIHRIEAVLPDLGAHLDRSVLTGTTCRYAPTEPVSWTLRSAGR